MLALIGLQTKQEGWEAGSLQNFITLKFQSFEFIKWPSLRAVCRHFLYVKPFLNRPWKESFTFSLADRPQKIIFKKWFVFLLPLLYYKIFLMFYCSLHEGQDLYEFLHVSESNTDS